MSSSSADSSSSFSHPHVPLTARETVSYGKPKQTGSRRKAPASGCSKSTAKPASTWKATTEDWMFGGGTTQKENKAPVKTKRSKPVRHPKAEFSDFFEEVGLNFVYLYFEVHVPDCFIFVESIYVACSNHLFSLSLLHRQLIIRVLSRANAPLFCFCQCKLNMYIFFYVSVFR